MRRVALFAAVPFLLAGAWSTAASSAVAASPPTTTSPHSIPGVSPPILTVTHPARNTQPGFVFVAQKDGGKNPGGPVIADNQGRIRWYHEVPHGLEATDFRTQAYRGKPVLTWWQGIISKAGVGRGEYEVYDTSYGHIATVKAAHGLDGDLHEFQLTPRGTAYITAYHEVPADLSGVGGPSSGYIYDSVVQEIDVATGKLVWEWNSLAHVPLEDSLEANHEPAKHASKQRPLDYFHVNSIADAPGGRVLVSARNTSTVYLLARSGEIVWRVGGKHSDFGPAAAVKFRYQHNARLHGADTLSLFDNGGIPRAEPFSRPLVLKLNVAKKTARIVKTFVHPKKIASPFEGDLQLLPNGGALVGWGGVRKVTEFGPGGGVRFELKLPAGDTYRAYRLRWTGRPTTRPAIARDGDTVYASWNGSTAVTQWQVLAGDDATHLHVVATHAWSGLETTIRLPSSPKAVAVRALGAGGRTLATSQTLD